MPEFIQPGVFIEVRGGAAGARADRRRRRRRRARRVSCPGAGRPRGADALPVRRARPRARRATLSEFLLAEFRSGSLAGDGPDDAFFVRCDRTTMTQDDFDNGRLVCIVGLAPLRPAEFVDIHIGRWTADHTRDLCSE